MSRKAGDWFRHQLYKLVGFSDLRNRSELPPILRKCADEIERHVAAESQSTDKPDGAA